MEGCNKDVEVVVGMGATEMLYSDREPYEVIAIKDDRHITVRRLSYKRTDNNGISESQDYEYWSDESNPVATLFRKKDGRWVEKYGRKEGCNTFVLGFAERYYDPCF